MTQTPAYTKQRDHFYKKHRYARVLLGIFIVSFAIYIGVIYRNYRARQYIGLQLLYEGIDPAQALGR